MVAIALDGDSEGLAFKCCSFLRYAEAFNALESAENEEALKAWKGSHMMNLAEEFAAERFKRNREAAKAADQKGK